MISNFIANNLLTDRGNRWMAQLDDSTSMKSIVIRDGLDTSGRTVMEYKRSQNGGRERLIEEVATLLIWGFGIQFMKERIYDPLARRFSRVQHPDMDISLFKDGAQKLTPELVEKFNNHDKFKGAYDNLLKVVKDEGGLQKLYNHSSSAKFLLATGLPVLAIAFGIPTFNQWLTRKKVEKEGLKPTPQASLTPATMAVPSFAQNIQNTTPVASPFGAMTSTSMAAAKPIPAGMPTTATMNQAASQPQFGSMGSLASALLQNERYNTLLVDGVISGGRVYKARNPVERAEIAFREALIIFFLYFAQAPIQKFFSQLFDKASGVHTQLDFPTLKRLENSYGANIAQFQQDYTAGMKSMTHILGVSEKELLQQAKDLEYIRNFRSVKKVFNPQKVAQLETLELQLETKLTNAVRNHFISGKADDLFFDVAKACGWIPTFEKNGTQMLDLTKRIDTQPILRMTGTFGNLNQDLKQVLAKTADPEKAKHIMSALMKKSLSGRAGAWVLANAVCFASLSVVGPKIQHLLTKRTTGKDYFPGVQVEQDTRSQSPFLRTV